MADDPIGLRAPGKWREAAGAPHTEKTGGDLMDSILATLEIPAAPMKVHALRSTFISMALEDGADDRLVEKITHTAGKTRRAFDRYDRADYWPQLCAEVGKIEIEPNRGGSVLRLGTGRSTVHGTAAGSGRDGSGISWRRRESNASVLPSSVLDDSPSRGVAVPLANARAPSRPAAVLPHGTAPGDALADLVVLLVARAIEATAARAPWSDSVRLAPGFAEDAARSAVGRITRALPDGEDEGEQTVGEGGGGRGPRRAISR